MVANHENPSSLPPSLPPTHSPYLKRPKYVSPSSSNPMPIPRVALGTPPPSLQVPPPPRCFFFVFWGVPSTLPFVAGGGGG